MTETHIPACVFSNYRELAEHRYKRLHGEPKPCRASDKAIREFEMEVANKLGFGGIVWAKEHQPMVVSYVVEQLTISMHE